MNTPFVFLLWKTQIVTLLVAAAQFSYAQGTEDEMRSSYPTYYLDREMMVTVDTPAMRSRKKTIVVFYALPNGNSTAWTIGRKPAPDDDWHYNIQHIGAQTRFIRREDRSRNYIVVYLENAQKSWPAWKQRFPDHAGFLQTKIDSLATAFGGPRATIFLNGHSGGGSLVFGFLSGLTKIPERVRRISFIDSNYGYDSSYYPVLREWLQNKKNSLTVFAYNDSVALYNGKPIVSATGGTWYRSRLMLGHLRQDFDFRFREHNSLMEYHSRKRNVHFVLKKNYDRGIYHTQQVELNGFIHSVFLGTKSEEKRYRYYGARAYDELLFPADGTD